MLLAKMLGRVSGRMLGNKRFVKGLMETTTPEAIAGLINGNAGLIAEVTERLDAEAMAGPMKQGMVFMGEVMQHVDVQALADIVNRNEKLVPELLDALNPNVFSRGAGSVLAKLRHATYRPPVMHREDE